MTRTLTDEFCRYEVGESLRHCGEPAEVIVWGKLFPKEALGPRCYKHAAQQVGHHALTDRRNQYAVYGLPLTETPDSET